MSVKKFAGWAGDVVGEFTGANDVEDAAEEAAKKTESASQQGVSRLESALESYNEQINPYLMAGGQAQELVNKELYGGGIATRDIAGYDSMLKSRQSGLESLSQGKAGMGTLFSGSTGRAAADLSGSQEQALRSQYMNYLMNQSGMGANLAQSSGATGITNASNIANLLMGGTAQANAYNMQGASAQQQSMQQLMGMGASLAGMMAGGPAGAAAGGAAAGGAGSYNPGSYPGAQSSTSFGFGY